MKTLALLLALVAHQQQQMKPPTPEEMQAAMAAMAPGPEHKELEALAGTWDLEITYAMGTGQKMSFAGRGVNTMILGGRFLTATTASREPKSGLAVDTLSIYGFDRRNGNFTIVAYDTMGTYYVTAAGKKAAGASQVVMKGEVEEHGGIKKYDMVVRWVDRDTYVTEIVFYLPQGPLKIVDITHRRVK